MEMKEWFHDDHGIPLHLKLNRPDGEEPCPQVLLFHGFTGHMEEPHLVYLTEKLVQEGYAVLRADLYGHGQSGGEFQNHTILKWLDNAEAVTACAKQMMPAGPLFLCGHSQGGLLALLSASRHPDLFDGVILLAPGVSVPDDLRRGNLLGTVFDPDHIPEYIDTWEDQKLSGEYIRTLKEVDPYAAARRVECPVLVIHGRSDEVIPAECAERIAAEFPCSQLCLIDGADHCFDGRFEEMASAAVSFLKDPNK